tara:strand:+ start:699 stop:1067 length:369 start_codon:yes stop_codon:yes gene_type:complete
MEDYKKFTDALNNLKLEAGFCYRGNYPMTEEKYATVEWATGVEADGETAIITTANPHSELTWTKVNAEMQRIQTEYDSLDYARKRQAEYPSIEELVVALYDTDDKAAIEAKRAEVKAKYPKP